MPNCYTTSLRPRPVRTYIVSRILRSVDTSSALGCRHCSRSRVPNDAISRRASRNQFGKAASPLTTRASVTQPPHNGRLSTWLRSSLSRPPVSYIREDRRRRHRFIRKAILTGGAKSQHEWSSPPLPQCRLLAKITQNDRRRTRRYGETGSLATRMSGGGGSDEQSETTNCRFFSFVSRRILRRGQTAARASQHYSSFAAINRFGRRPCRLLCGAETKAVDVYERRAWDGGSETSPLPPPLPGKRIVKMTIFSTRLYRVYLRKGGWWDGGTFFFCTITRRADN